MVKLSSAFAGAGRPSSASPMLIAPVRAAARKSRRDSVWNMGISDRVAGPQAMMVLGRRAVKNAQDQEEQPTCASPLPRVRLVRRQICASYPRRANPISLRRVSPSRTKEGIDTPARLRNRPLEVATVIFVKFSVCSLWARSIYRAAISSDQCTANSIGASSLG